MDTVEFNIIEIKPGEKSYVETFIAENWGSASIVTRAKIYNASELPGFVFKSENKIIGLITYNIVENDCEIVSLDSKMENKGLGSDLLNRVINIAREKKCKRVWLVTTNDNIKALKFYQKRGFEWIAFYQNAVINSRKLKPEIPEFGMDNIPVKHELEFEIRL